MPTPHSPLGPALVGLGLLLVIVGVRLVRRLLP